MNKRLIFVAVLSWCTALCAQSNPVPLINQPLSPDAAAPGGAGFILTVNGTGFVTGAVVDWNGSARVTTFVNSGELKATILASDITAPGTGVVNVINPAPGGGTSNPSYFQIVQPSSTPPTFAVVLATVGTPVAETPVAAAAGDFNGDGAIDLAVADFDGSPSGNFISVLLNAGNGTFPTHAEYAAGQGPISIIAADFNGDGKLDLAVSNSNADSISILLGNGDGTFQPHVDYATGSFPAQVVTGDFNRDGKLDLAVVNVVDGSVSILLGNGDGTFQPRVDYTLGTFPFYLVVGDFNGDNKLDLAVINRGDDSISIVLGNGDGTFVAQPAFSTGLFADAIATADFNGDGKLDLAIAINNNGSGDNVSVLLGNGNGTFQPATPYATPNQPTWITTGDFNGDGKIDLAVASDNCPPSGNCGTGQASIFLGNVDGTFQSRVDTGINAQIPNAVVAADFNNDGQLDLALPTGSPCCGGTTVSVLTQTTNSGAPLVTLSTISVDFGTAVIGGKVPRRVITVTNTGSATLEISSISLSTGDATDYTQKNNCGSQLLAGAACQVTVGFHPHKINSRVSQLNIADNANGSPQIVTLTGMGTYVSLSSAALNFGAQRVGTKSPSKTITVTNEGNFSIAMQGIAIGGANPKDFTETNTCGRSLETKHSCKVSVAFTPTAKGARSAEVLINDNGGASPQQVSLAGTGD
jgi:FG-GAP-like repeat